MPQKKPTRPTGSRRAEPASAKVRLLSGGNPQIGKGDGPEVVETYLAAMPGWKQDIGRLLDELAVRHVPGLQKAVRWNSPFYGTAKHGWFMSMHCITKYVKVAFFNGTSLEPPPPVESKHDATRYVHLHEGEDVDETRLVRWIKQSSKLPGWTGFGH